MKSPALPNEAAFGVSRRVVEALRSVLPSEVPVHLVRVDGELLHLSVNGQPLSARWLGEGRLRVARAVVGARGRPDVVVARVMSPGARDALAAAGMGWVDETGAAEIALAGLVVSRSGLVHVGARPARWTRGVLAVAEALLCGTSPTVSATTAATGLSQGTCGAALRALAELGLLASDAARGRRSARRLTNPDALLDAYTPAAAALAPVLSLAMGVTWQDPIDGLARVGDTLDGIQVSWAATGFAAASVLAPLLTTVSSAELYVEADTMGQLDRLGRDLGLRPIAGGRLTLRPFPTRTSDQLAIRIEGVRVVPWPRLYADLVPQGVRGEEVAEHVRDTIRGH